MNRFLWTGAGALGLWLGMPNPLYQLPVLALLYPAALFALGHGSANWKQALRSGWLCGLVGASACTYWVAIPVHEFGGLPWPLAAPCALLMGAYIGLYGGLFAVLTQILCGKGKRHTLIPWQNALALGLGWYLFEWFRGWFLTGFPWLSLSTAFAPWPVFLQGASVLGGYGLSGLFAGLVCLLVQSASGRTKPVLSGKLGARHRRHLSQWNRRNRFPLWGGLLCFALLAVFGLWRTEIANPVEDLTTASKNTADTSADSPSPVPVTLVQGNLDQNVKWEPSMQRLTVQRYLTLSNEALAFPAPEVGRPRLLIWPETAMPFNYQRNKDLSTQLREYTREHNIALLFGAPGFRRMLAPNRASEDTPDKTDTFNRAYLITAGTDTDWYEKEHLVPFGEYMPPYLDFSFLQPLLQGVGHFTPGEKKVPLPVLLPETPLLSLDDGSSDTFTNGAASRNAPNRPLVLGVLICYETVFPELARQRVTDGAEVFVNISNDAWFGLSPAPMQHLQLTLMRAVEQGRWLMRATNTGISAFIDPVGRIRDRTDLFKTQTLSALVPPLTSVTVFYHTGPWLPGTAFLLFLWLCRKRYPVRRKHTS